MNKGDRISILEGERLIRNKHRRQLVINAIKEIGREAVIESKRDLAEVL